MEYSLTRSKRKTAAIYIRNGGVDVRAPLKMPKRDIDTFVASKEKWIENTLAKSIEQAKRREAFALNYGDMIPYRGTAYPILPKDGKLAGFTGSYFYLPPNLTSEQIKAVCVQVYRRLAKAHLTERTVKLAEHMGVTPASVKINGAKTRWGSCTAKKNINYSWRLVMADDEVIDYVVTHELAHINELNHSDRFWAVVARFLPDHKKRRRRLKDLQKRLLAEDWE